MSATKFRRTAETAARVSVCHVHLGIGFIGWIARLCRTKRNMLSASVRRRLDRAAKNRRRSTDPRNDLAPARRTARTVTPARLKAFGTAVPVGGLKAVVFEAMVDAHNNGELTNTLGRPGHTPLKDQAATFRAEVAVAVFIFLERPCTPDSTLRILKNTRCVNT